MDLNNLFPSELNGIGTDFRAEVIAAELIENNTAADRILIVPLGAMHRPQRKDIESILEEVSEYDNKEYTLIRTHKEGLYDKLPEGLFHSPISHDYSRTEQQVIDSIKRHRVEEREARKFFLPFDAGLYNVRVQIALYENQLDKKFHFNQLVNIFSSHWEIFQYLNVLQANIFLQFLPIIHMIRDDWKVIETLFEQMFMAPAQLRIRDKKNQKNSDSQGVVFAGGLGQSMLGVDLVTGDATEVGATEMVITFGPLTSQQLKDFIGHMQQERVVKMLCDYLLPAEMDIVMDYDLLASERGLVLTDDRENATSCDIGVTTYI
ncbi:MAG: type secretion system baseplate subunit TssG [Segetibacter sp.]|jgi:hypothetical protein|nr:type secretion system baseplate subunit TssG [Segetibacter sp.]